MRLVRINKEYEERLHEIEQHRQAEVSMPPVRAEHYDGVQCSSTYYRTLLGSPVQPQTIGKLKHDYMLVQDGLNASLRSTVDGGVSLGRGPAVQGRLVSSKEQKLNHILSRIRLRESGSRLEGVAVGANTGAIESRRGRASPDSAVLEREKDLRMRNISHKLEQLRADIRREIGLIPN